MMFNTLRAVNYNNKLIEMLLYSKMGAVSVNILGPLFYAYVLSKSVPIMLLIIFILLQFIIFIARIIYGKKLSEELLTNTNQKNNISLKKYLFFLYMSSFLWGLSTLVALYFGSESEVFMIMAMIFIMIAGSLVALTPIFHAVFSFITNIILIFVLSLIFIGATETYFLMASFLIIFYLVTINGAFKIYSAMSDSISKSEKIEFLNLELENRVLNAVRETEEKEKLLQQQARLAQMGEMISMIAHQWRQPLGAISSSVFSIQTKNASGKFNLDIKEDRDKLSEFSNKKLEHINEYVQSLSTTIDDFRNFFKPDKEKELVTLSAPIKRALQIVESSMRSKNIEITTLFENDDKILMYQNEMMQVILNILKNAEDNFVEKNIQNPHAKIRTYKESGMWVISISDNGGGISEDILPNIFDPYFSTKDEKNGTGLGLYMSKIMVEEHNGGKLNVKNTDKGVCFEIFTKESN